jgi:hypothetical protein
MNKYIYIIIILVVIVAGAVAFILFRNGVSPSGNGNVQTPAGGEGALVLNPVDTSSFPKGDTIVLGTPHGSVTVNNFYKLAQGQEDAALLIKQTNDYFMSYNMADSSFWIFVTAAPVDAAEKAAENDLLGILGVSGTQACYLNISWGISPSVDQSRTGKSYPLSFCTGASL